MMAVAPAEQAKRLARHRAELELALAEGLTIAEARERLARQRWAEADARLTARRIGRCGTAAASESDEARPRYWWQDL